MGLFGKIKAKVSGAIKYVVQPTYREEVKKQKVETARARQLIVAQEEYAKRVLSTKTPLFQLQTDIQNPQLFLKGVYGRAKEAGASQETLDKISKMDPNRLVHFYTQNKDLFTWYFAYDDDAESYTQEEEMDRQDMIVAGYEELFGPIK